MQKSLLFTGLVLSNLAFSDTKQEPPVPPPENKEGFFLSGDFIYWQPSVQGVDYAVSGIKAGTADLGPVKRGKIFDPDFKYSPGFKLGAGYTLGPSKEWDLFLNYTWLQSSAKSSVTANNFAKNLAANALERVFNIWAHPQFSATGNGQIRFGSAKWNLHFQTLDLELARNMQLRKSFFFKPHAGLRAGWIDQTYNLFYEITDDNEANLTVLGIKVPMKNRFWGVGPRVGIDTLWKFTPHWGLFGNVGASLLWGKFRTHQKNDEISNTTGSTVNTPRGVVVDVSSSFHTIAPELDIALGLHAETHFHKDYLFEANLAWELQTWFHQNQLFYFTDSASLGNGMRQEGNLSLQGLTFEIKLHF